MFFVTLLLNELVAWMRSQPGTSSLRALLYMDEVFGYFPPTANPPSKQPMLTLLKQARAYGLGVVLATQNPVDLDYKGLSNAGTWFLGRLQTERDLERVLDGLEGASTSAGGGFDRKAMEATLAGLKSRVFLMNNVHENEPVLFHTRWVLSYLRGPLTREQIRALSAPRKLAVEAASVPAAAARDAKPRVAGPPAASTEPASPPSTSPADERPVLPAGVAELFRPVTAAVTDTQALLYRPGLLGSADLHFVSARAKLDHWEEVTLEAPLSDDTVRDPWDAAEPRHSGGPALLPSGESGARFASLPAEAGRAATFKRWSRSLADHLYRNRTVTAWKCPELNTLSRAGESEAEFRARLALLAREKRDLQVRKLEKRYSPKLARIRERIRKAQSRVDREQSQYGQQKLQTAVSLGATVLGALFGRKAASVGTVQRAGTTLRGVGRARREKGDIARARADLEAQGLKLHELEREFADEVAEVRDALSDPTNLELQEIKVRPRKSDIAVERVALVWTPWKLGPEGIAEPAARREGE
jgi:hypothetical protein